MTKIGIFLCALIFICSIGNSFGQSDRFLHFDGVNDYVVLPNASQHLVGASGVSMTGWFYAENPGYGRAYMGLREPGANNEMYIIEIGGATLECRYITPAGGLQQYVSPVGTVQGGVWQHVAWSSDGAATTLYINGIPIGSTTSVGAFTSPATDFTIGTHLINCCDFYFSGKIDEVSVWSKGLTQAEILDMMANELVGNEANLELYYKMDQGVPGGNNTAITQLVSEVGAPARNGNIVNFALNGGSSNFFSVIPDPSFTFADFCFGHPNAPTITGDPSGTFSFNPAPADGASINPATGEITGEVVGATYSVMYTTPGPCPDTETNTVTVLQLDDPSFTLTDFCEGAANSATAIASPGGTFSLSPNPGDGATINGLTGEITGGIVGTTYNVLYLTNTACTNLSFESVTVLVGNDPSFTLTDFCVGDPNNATGIITGGGTFSFNPDPADGATINVSTAEITGEVAGTTYNVEYTFSGACTNSSIEQVTINPGQDASFTLTDFCAGAPNSATITGTAGGTFSFSPDLGDGSSINTGTGEISSGVVGTTYTVDYTISGTCTSSTTQTVSVTGADDASFTLTDFCAGTANNATITGTVGGTFSFSPDLGDGSTVDGLTGEITGGVSGTTYTLDYTTGGTCSASTTQTVSVTGADDASFTLTDFCAGTANNATITGTTGGTFSFSPDLGDGSTVDGLTGEITGGVSGTTYTLDYTTGGTCSASTTQTVSVTGADDASFTLTDFCAGTANNATITGTVGGTFSFSPDLGDGSTVDGLTGEITGGVSGTTYTLDYTTGGTCSASTTQTVTVTGADDASFTLTDFCAGTANNATITGTTGGTFSFSPDLGDGSTVDGLTGEITGGVSGTTYTLDYTTGGTCSASTTQTVTVTGADDASFTLTDFCAGTANNATITGTVGGTFSFSPDLGDGSTVDGLTGEITGGVSGTTYTLDYTTGGTCSASTTQTVSVTGADDASFTLTDFCAGTANNATITGTVGGTFSFSPDLGDGSTVDGLTGEITSGVSGTTYTLDYTTGGTCSASTTQTVSVTGADDASFTLTDFCAGTANNATITGTTGGTFSFSPDLGDGSTVDGLTGEITGGVSGTTYTLDYTTGGTCSASTTQTVSVTGADDASFTLTDFCAGTANNATIVGTTGGTFSFSPDLGDGSTVDGLTGEITSGVSGTTYTLDYTTGGTCSASTTQTVSVTGADDASFTLTDFCAGTANNATITGTTGGTFSFSPDLGDGSTVDGLTGEITGGVSGTTYTLDYTTGGTCSASTTQTVSVTGADDASFTLTDFCAGTANNATIVGTTGGTFSFSPDLGDGSTVDGLTGEITGGVSGTTYTLDYTTGGTCSASTTQTVSVTGQTTQVLP